MAVTRTAPRMVVISRKVEQQQQVELLQEQTLEAIRQLCIALSLPMEL